VFLASRKFSVLLTGLALFFLLANLVRAAEFSAVTATKAGKREQQGKLYVKGDKARIEAVTPMGPSVIILRLDKKVMWLLLPGPKGYVEMPIDKEAFAKALKIPAEGVSKKFLGHETLRGYDTEKYETTAIVGGRAVKGLMWIAPKLEIPIRIESADESFSQDYDIKEGGVDDALFEMPAGYQKMTMPAGMPKMQ
jgi:hypothetical protein